MAQLHVTLFLTKKYFQIRLSIFEESRGQKKAFLPHFHNAVTRQWTDGFGNFFIRKSIACRCVMWISFFEKIPKKIVRFIESFSNFLFFLI